MNTSHTHTTQHNDALVMLYDSCTQRDTISTVEYQHIRVPSYIQYKVPTVPVFAWQPPTWSTTPVKYLPYSNTLPTHTLKGWAMQGQLTAYLYSTNYTAIVLIKSTHCTYNNIRTQAYKKAEPRPTGSVWQILRSSNSETKSSSLYNHEVLHHSNYCCNGFPLDESYGPSQRWPVASWSPPLLNPRRGECSVDEDSHRGKHRWPCTKLQSKHCWLWHHQQYSS